MTTHPIAVIGSGYIGSLMAISLAKRNQSVFLVDPTPLSHHLKTDSDGRAISITQASKHTFEQLGLWEALAPHAEPLLTVRTQESTGEEMCLSTEHAQDQPLGYMVDAKALKDTLLQKAHNTPLITCFTDRITHLESHTPFDSSLEVHLANEGSFLASLVIGADGTQSRTRQCMNLRTHQWSYDQTAFVRVYQHTSDHQGYAYEKFLETGPFAILPLPGNRSSIVWSASHEKAKQLSALSEEAFDQEAFQHMKGYEGLTPCSPVRSWPLKGLWTPHFVGHRMALVGDAAHRIHPLAGQGFNLGAQDVQVLEETISKGLSLGLDIGSRTLLQQYEQKQRWQHLTLLGVTEGLNRLFSNEDATLKWIRKRGLQLVEGSPTLKSFFARKGTGLKSAPFSSKEERSKSTSSDKVAHEFS